MIDFYQQVVAAIATSAYWQSCAVAFVLMAIVFFVNARRRATVESALGEGMQRGPLRMFDLNHGSTEDALKSKHLIVPERLWTYDEQYLERFARVAAESAIRGEGSALRLYLGAILRRWDFLFAVLLATVVGLIDFGIAKTVADIHPSWTRVAILAGCMAILYGAADIAEDFKLVTILRMPDEIDAGEAAAANFLTRAKLVALTASGFGIAIYLTLYAIAAAAVRPPVNPAGEVVPAIAG
jgi:hypothetical protein